MGLSRVMLLVRTTRLCEITSYEMPTGMVISELRKERTTRANIVDLCIWSTV